MLNCLLPHRWLEIARVGDEDGKQKVYSINLIGLSVKQHVHIFTTLQTLWAVVLVEVI